MHHTTRSYRRCLLVIGYAAAVICTSCTSKPSTATYLHGLKLATTESSQGMLVRLRAEGPAKDDPAAPVTLQMGSGVDDFIDVSGHPIKAEWLSAYLKNGDPGSDNGTVHLVLTTQGFDQNVTAANIKATLKGLEARAMELAVPLGKIHIDVIIGDGSTDHW